MIAATGLRAEIVVVTPEGVRFGLPLAAPPTRLLAWLIDILAISTIAGVMAKFLILLSVLSEDLMSAALLLFYFATSVGYPMAFERLWSGQTPGKRVMGLRVVDTRGLKLELSQIVIRNLMRLVDELPLFYLVGGAAMLVSRDAQRLGDLAAGTAVVRLASGSPFDGAPLAFGKYNSLLAYPHLAARLRQKAPPALVQLAADALARRDELNFTSRVKLFEELAGRFRALVAFPEEASQGLTGEQYVSNALQAIVQVRARNSARAL